MQMMPGNNILRIENAENFKKKEEFKMLKEFFLNEAYRVDKYLVEN